MVDKTRSVEDTGYCFWNTDVPWKLHTRIKIEFIFRNGNESRHQRNSNFIVNNEIGKWKKHKARWCNAIHQWGNRESRDSIVPATVKVVRAQGDALALRADERRDKLRKASGRSTYPMIRRYLNGETRQRKPLSACSEYIAYVGNPGNWNI